MTAGLKIVIPVSDLAAAKRLYGELVGVGPSMDEAYYVGFDLDGVHLGLDPNGAANGLSGPVAYWPVDDIAARLAALVDTGAQEQQPVTDVGGGASIATVKDGDGNVVGLIGLS